MFTNDIGLQTEKPEYNKKSECFVKQVLNDFLMQIL